VSNGNSHPITLNGGYGQDKFDVVRNMQLVDIRGDSDVVSVTVRSYFHYVSSVGGRRLRRNFDRELTIVHDYVGAMVGDGAVPLNFPENHRINADDFPLYHFVKCEDLDYVVNSQVRVDGGTHGDLLSVVGTEGDDSFVIADRSIYGGGLSIEFTAIEALEVMT